jgi:hypothetical protein
MARVAGFSWVKGAAGLSGIKQIPREDQPGLYIRRRTPCGGVLLLSVLPSDADDRWHVIRSVRCRIQLVRRPLIASNSQEAMNSEPVPEHDPAT